MDLEIRDIPFAFVFYYKEYWHITWKTHLAFAACVSLLLWLPFFILYRIKNRKPEVKNILLAATSATVGLFLAEAFLCIVPIGRTYLENQGSAYASIFTPSKNRLYHRDAAVTLNQKNAEFEYSYRTNQAGFVGKEWTLNKTPNQIRVVSSGDSFTEGVGAPMDSAYPVLLQQILGGRYHVLNLGVSGSDPVFGYKTIEEIMLPYQPDVVVQTVSENDITVDFAPRGGFERFVGDSLLRFKTPPAIEPLYAVSYTSRLFIEVLGISPVRKWYSESYIRKPEVIEERNKILFDLLSRYEKLAAENHFKVYIVFLPMVHEMKERKYLFDFTPAKDYITALQHVKYIDLMPCYTSKMGENQDLIYHYYWRQDKHHNSAGYQLMASCIAEEIVK